MRPGGVASQRGARRGARDTRNLADFGARLAARSRRAETAGTGATSRRDVLFVLGVQGFGDGTAKRAARPATRRGARLDSQTGFGFMKTGETCALRYVPR